MQNEVFGPVLTWQTFAVRSRGDRARQRHRVRPRRDAVHARRASARERVAARVVAGTVWVNCFFVRDLDAPFGGARNSGIGREGGAWSFDFFCDVKNVAIKRGSFVGTERSAMGEIVAAAVVAHQPMVMVPETVRVELGGTGADTTLIEPGYRLLREAVRGARGRHVRDHRHALVHDHRARDRRRRALLRASTPATRCRGTSATCRTTIRARPSSPQAWHQVGKERGSTPSTSRPPSLPQHYPTINLVHHLRTREKRAVVRRRADRVAATTTSRSAPRWRGRARAPTAAASRSSAAAA